MRYGTHEKRVPGLAVNDALKDVVLLDANRHQEELRGEFPFLSWTKSPLQALLLLGQAPVCCQNLHQVGKLDLEAELYVDVQASMGIVIYVPEDVSTVSWLLEIGTQMGPMIPCVQSERGEEVLVIAESTLELREAILKDFSWFRLVVVNVGLEGRQGHRAIRGIRLQKFPQDPRLVGVTCGNRAKLPERFCPA